MDYRIEDEFEVTATRYWEVFFTEEYNKAMFETLDIGWELLSLERRGEGDALVIERTQRLTPRREVPGFLAKFVADKIAYTEHNVFTASKNEMKTVTTPSFMAEKIKTEGLYRLQPVGDTKVLRIWEGLAVAKIPLLGGRVEKHLVEEIRESYRNATAFTRKWHADHPA
ncbi:MAG: DUF2505 family protein [Myxococcota bacterium]